MADIFSGTFTKSATPKLTITVKGKKKIQEAERAVRFATVQAMLRTMPEYLRLLASFSPTPTQERQLLSEGTIFGGRYVTRGPRKGELETSQQTVGTPKGGRFLRTGNQMSVRAAIAESEPVVRSTPARIFVTTARAQEINAKTGFSWRTKHRGIQDTEPYNHRLMQALEDGGVWEVRRRSSALLNPEPGVYAGRMIKTLEPWGMYRRARVAIRDKMAANIKADVAAALKRLT
jgi:hypothetical protein